MIITGYQLPQVQDELKTILNPPWPHLIPIIRAQAISFWAAIAQLVEHRIRNARVGCSSHPGGTIICLAAIPRFAQASDGAG